MNNDQKISLTVLIGVPILFLIITLITERWGFFLWRLSPSFTAGSTGFFHAKNDGDK
ncbi:hypothetical protein [Lentibacillus salinarum]|uniref:Uncharacterized protein n=1 Tax=Lentibacillus salinarum TaxID=446820 RepID=A0ABW3ZS84_9BACI